MKYNRLLVSIAGSALLLYAVMLITSPVRASDVSDALQQESITATLHIYSTDTWSYVCNGGTVVPFENGCAHYDYETEGNYETLRRWFVCGPTQNTTITQQSLASHRIYGWGYTNMRVSIPIITDTTYTYYGVSNDAGDNELSTGEIITTYFVSGGSIAWGDIAALGSSGHLTYSVDVCLGDATIPVSPTTASYCSDGTELISDVVTLGFGETWEYEDAVTEWDYIQARFTISNPVYPDSHIYGNATLNDSTYLWSPDLTYDYPISFTVPTAFRYTSEPNGPTATVSLRNTGYGYDLLSVCLIPYTQTTVPAGCNLVNYNFVGGIDDWDYTAPAGSYLAEGDGAMQLDSGEWASQYVTATGVFNIQVRARSTGSSADFTLGGYAVSNILEGDTVYSHTASSDYSIYDGRVFFQRQGFGLDRSYVGINALDDSLIVDWVCLKGYDTSGLPYEFPISECTFPDYSDHPDFSITEIGNWILWLATKFGQLISWLLCELMNLLFQVANFILRALRSLLDLTGIPDFPAFPTEITFDSVMEWLRQVYQAFFTWLGLNFQNLRNSIPNIAVWLWGALRNLGSFIVYNLLWPLVEWVLEHVAAALGIGEDTINQARAIWRDAYLFLIAAQEEASYEFDDLMLLMGETASVFGVLITGFRGSVTGTAELDFGEDLNGLAAFLWRGVEFINDSVSLTPLSALNIVALGIITIGIAQWTIQKFVSMLERFS